MPCCGEPRLDHEDEPSYRRAMIAMRSSVERNLQGPLCHALRTTVGYCGVAKGHAAGSLHRSMASKKPPVWDNRPAIALGPVACAYLPSRPVRFFVSSHADQGSRLIDRTL